LNAQTVRNGSRKKAKAGSVIGILVLIFITIIMLFPIFIMITTSLKSLGEIFQFPPSIIPKNPSLDNYVNVFKTLNFLPYFKNSILVSACVVVGTLLSSSLVAFGFSRYDAPGKKLLFMLLLATMMIPYPSIMIPQFLLFNQLQWIDTLKPLVVPAFFGSAYMVFLLKQFFGSLNNELFDAARIDGCNEFRVYRKIALPLCKPALATVAIFSFIWSWDDLLSPVIYLNSTENYTLPVLLASMTSKFRVPPWNTMMSAALLTALPCMLLFIFCQKYFVEGIVTTGLKG
jgi:multiple sugar transport system permease protein